MASNASTDTNIEDSRGVALGDLDGDGDLDAFVVNRGQANRVYLNNASAGFMTIMTQVHGHGE